MSGPLGTEVQTVDLMRGGLQLLQDPAGFCFGIDAVLLTGFVDPASTGRLLDLGTGTGVIPILLTEKTKCTYLAGLEIHASSARLAQESVRRNGLTDRVEIVEGDIREAGEIFAAASFDVITSNPPYFAAGKGRYDPADPRAAARHEILCTFSDVSRAAARLLKRGGHFYLVHRPERLPELLGTLCADGLEPKRLRMVQPFRESAPNMVLIDCVRGARPSMKTEPALIIYEAPGIYTEEVLRIYGMETTEGHG